MVKNGAKTDLPWCALIANLARFNIQLPTDPKDLLNSQLFHFHRYVIEIYRASGRDNNIFSVVRAILFWKLQFNNDWYFFTNIENYDEMLATAEAEISAEKKPASA